MPEIITRHFGVVHYEVNAVILFPAGLPAFEWARRFLLLDRPATSIIFIQSLEDLELCFMALPVLTISPEYELGVSDDDLQALGLNPSQQPLIGSELACLAILSVTDDSFPTVNLMSPVVVNLENRIAVQAIRSDSLYSHQHSLTPEGIRCL